MDEDDEKPHGVIDEAMDWLLRLKAAPGDLDVLRGFEMWKSQSEAHAEAFGRARRVWDLMGIVPPVHEAAWRDETAASSGAAHRRLRAGRGARHPSRPGFGPERAAVTALAAVSCVAFALAWPSIRIAMDADYATSTAMSRDVHLADGSRVTLGADSAMQADMSSDGRRVRLLAGEAFFYIVRDESRPFEVEADGTRVAVLGTRFDVRLSATATSVEVEEGGVAVSVVSSDVPQRLAPGETITIDRQTGAMRRGTIAPADVGAWRDGRLFVNDATIGSVVEVLRRYHSGWIGLPDEGLAAEKVTGLYDLGDTDRALRALVEPHGGTVHSLSAYVRVLSRH